MKQYLTVMGASVALLLTAPASAIGVLVPTDTKIEPLAIQSHRVEVTIKDRTAETKVVQVFKNSTSSQLEATYIFPLPKGAAISDFALWMDGKRQSGEVLEKEKAKEIYEDIVRRMKDPGLLEYMGGDLFKARIFPIPANGEQKVEISFTTTLDREGGVSHYTYPLKTGGKSASTLSDFTLTVKIESKTPIKSVYSPSHSISTTRKDDYHATVGFEYDRALLEKDFQLYYSLSKDEVGVDLLTFKRKGEPGYFMMLASPKQDYSEKEILGKHVTFVIDTSGSMSGEKMERARKALIYCIEHLSDDDTFSIIRFSSDVESFEKEPKPATKEWKEKAVSFAKKMEAAGGTAIYDSLMEAMKVKSTNSGPSLVVFLTDGSPTVGETDPKKIADSVAKANAGEYRIFVFGVGETVNVVLLDRIAADNGGFAEYAKPDAEVETVLTSFYDKIAYPVLGDVSIDVEKVKVYDTFPRELGDLYKGQQVLVFGRYKETGGTVITLKGTLDGKEKKFEYEGEFADENSSNDFIPLLWATRKVGYLLEEIRIHGEEKELKEEVIKLAKEFGIVTPYTSYLVVEEPSSGSGSTPTPVATPSVPRWGTEDEEKSMDDGDRGRSGGGKGGKKEKSVTKAPSVSADPFKDSDKSPKAPEAKPDYGSSSGEGGVSASKDTKGKKEAQKKEDNGYSKYVDGRMFLWNGDTWLDSSYDTSMKTLEIASLSDAYFAVLALKPEFAKFFALGDSVVIVVSKTKAIVIKASGKTSVAEKDLKEFLK